jgi:cysteine-S-conjugate beta-lyase
MPTRCDLDTCVDRRCTESAKWCHYGADVLPMWVADMDFPSPEPVVRALRERVEHGVFGYGIEPPELRPTLVARLQQLYGWSVPPEAIVFLPGVVVGLNLACRALAAPGEGVLVQTPVYPPILRAHLHAGLVPCEMELTRGPDGRYSVDWEAFERAITPRARLFILCDPHNPVGRVFAPDELSRMAEICLRHDMLICSDEIHGDLVYRGYPHRPIASLSREVEAHTITLMAPSKTFNIAGLHCAFAVIPNTELRARYVGAGCGLLSGPSILSYVAALAAYREGEPWLAEVLRYLEGNRDFLQQTIGESLPGIGVGPIEGTYLAWLDCRSAGITENAYEFFLRQARVAVNDGADFGRGGAGFVRLNFGCPRSQLAEALQRMAEALAQGAVQV